jgi:hypothetical protein
VNGRSDRVVKQQGIAAGLAGLEVDVSTGLFPAQWPKLVADGDAVDEIGMLGAPQDDAERLLADQENLQPCQCVADRTRLLAVTVAPFLSA